MSEELFYLPTPTVSDSKGAARSEVADGNPHGRLKVEVELFPTIVASEGVKATAAQGSEQKAETGQVWLTNIAHDLATENGLPTPVGLLPTPRVSSGNGSTAKERAAGNPKKRLETEAEMNDAVRWGKFEPAIKRWEQVLGRPAPAPTKPDGKDGSHRLSSSFTEWMMGLPEGWITGVGLSRNEELKACGNGVVPQQAELALRILLNGVVLPESPDGNLLPTPTTQDKRDGTVMRSVAIENLENGKNRGIGLNHLVEAVGVDWQEGDTFKMTDAGLEKNVTVSRETEGQTDD